MPDNWQYDINALAKACRQRLREEFPLWKFSVTLKKYSGGRTMKVALMAGPVPIVERYRTYQNKIEGEWIAGMQSNGHAQLSRYAFSRAHENYGDRRNNGTVLTQRAWDMLAKVVEIADNGNWNNSDSQTDYFDVNFYLNIDIGKWDRPYVIDGTFRSKYRAQNWNDTEALDECDITWEDIDGDVNEQGMLTSSLDATKRELANCLPAIPPDDDEQMACENTLTLSTWTHDDIYQHLREAGGLQ